MRIYIVYTALGPTKLFIFDEIFLLMRQNDHCRIYMRVSPAEFERFKIFKENGYSAREILEIINEKCSESPIIIYSKKTREPLQIPSNILSKKRR